VSKTDFSGAIPLFICTQRMTSRSRDKSRDLR